MTYRQQVVLSHWKTLGSTNIGKLRNVNKHNVIWDNYKTEYFVQR